MHKKPIVVVDTNVIVSALFGIKKTPPFQILRAIRFRQIIFMTSPEIIEEFIEVINREKIAKFIPLNRNEREVFIGELVERSVFVPDKLLIKMPSRDIDDHKFLACSSEGKADYLVTGDKDLLVLEEFEGTRIVTAREFVEEVLRKG